MKPGKGFDAEARFINLGDNSPASTIQFILVKGESEIEVTTSDLDPLAKFTSTFKRFFIPISEDTQEGVYIVRVCVEAVTNETELENNCAEYATRLRIGGGFPWSSFLPAITTRAQKNTSRELH